MNLTQKILKDLGLPTDKNPYHTEGKWEGFDPSKSNLYQHAKKEMENGDNDFAKVGVLELIACFSMQGHSGMSAPWTINIVKKLAMFGILSPLTGKDDEWVEGSVGDGSLQNKRLSSVFKEKDGSCYDNSAWRVETTDGGGWGRSVRRPVTFPYSQEKKVIYVANDEELSSKTEDEWAKEFEKQ